MARHAQRRKEQIQPSEFDPGFSAQEAEIARIVVGVPDKPEDWDGILRVTLANLYGETLFMSQRIGFLNHRAQSIEKAVKGQKLLDGAKVDRRYINNLSGGQPITLLQCVKISEVCNRLSRHQDAAMRALVASSGVFCVIPSNSIIASIYWASRADIAAFRRHVGLTQKELGRLAFGKTGYSDGLFDRLESGAKGKNGKRFDYRVSKFTADRVWFTMFAVWHHFPSKQTDEYVSFPAQELFFEMRKNIGRGQGDRSIALPFDHGNQDRPVSAKDGEDIVERVSRLALEKGEPPVVACKFEP